MKEIIKPEKIISPFLFAIVIIAIGFLIAFIVVITISIMDENGVIYFNEWTILTGAFFTVPSALIIGYLRLVLLTRSIDFTALAQMKSLSILAVYPLIDGAATFCLKEMFDTIRVVIYNNVFLGIPWHLSINLVELLSFGIVTFSIIELYITMKRDNTLERIKEHNRSTSND